MVSKELAIEFQKAVKKDREIDITEKQAEMILNDLTKFFDLLAEIDQKTKFNENKK